MRQRLRELLASGLAAVAVLIILWFVLGKVVSVALWLVNTALIVAVVVLLFAAARRLRGPKQRIK